MQGEIDVNDGMVCCGVQEISGISNYRNPFDAIHDILTDADGAYDDELDAEVESLDVPNAAHLIFTQASRFNKPVGYGYKLKQHIEENGLGSVVVAAPAKNPNTGRYIHTFVWALNVRGIQKWAKEKGIAIQ